MNELRVSAGSPQVLQASIGGRSLVVALGENTVAAKAAAAEAKGYRDEASAGAALAQAGASTVVGTSLALARAQDAADTVLGDVAGMTNTATAGSHYGNSDPLPNSGRLKTIKLETASTGTGVLALGILRGFAVDWYAEVPLTMTSTAQTFTAGTDFADTFYPAGTVAMWVPGTAGRIRRKTLASDAFSVPTGDYAGPGTRSTITPSTAFTYAIELTLEADTGNHEDRLTEQGDTNERVETGGMTTSVTKYSGIYAVGPVEPAPGAATVERIDILSANNGAFAMRILNVSKAGDVLARWDITAPQDGFSMSPGDGLCPIPADYSPPAGSYFMFAPVNGSTLNTERFLTYASDAERSTREYLFDAAADVGDALYGGDERQGVLANIRIFYRTDPPARLKALEAASFPPAPLYDGDARLWAFRQKVGMLLSGTAQQVRVGVTGDSWTERRFISEPLAELLWATYGTVGWGWVSANAGNNGNDAYPYAGHTFASTGTWTQYDASLGAAPLFGCGPDGFAIHTAATDATAQLNFVGTGFTTYYREGDGTFRYRVDGGAWTAVTGDGSGDLGSVVVTGLSAGAHAVDFDTTGNTGTAAIWGHRIIGSGASGVDFVSIGNGGTRAKDYLNVTPFIAPIMSDVPLDALVIILGTNDSNVGDLPGTYRLGLREMIAQHRAANPNVGIVLVVPPENGGAAATPMSELRDAAWEEVQSDGDLAFLNLLDMQGPFAATNAMGVWNSGESPPVHQSAAGGAATARDIFGTFFEVPA